jgi:hypothetical protein
LVVRSGLLDILGKRKPDQEKHGVTKQDLLLCVGQISCIRNKIVDALLEILSHVEKIGPIFVHDLLKTSPKP